MPDSQRFDEELHGAFGKRGWRLASSSCDASTLILKQTLHHATDRMHIKEAGAPLLAPMPDGSFEDTAPFGPRYPAVSVAARNFADRSLCLEKLRTIDALPTRSLRGMQRRHLSFGSDL